MTTPSGAQCRVSVLLVTYNQQRYIGRALRSLLGQALDGPIQVIVADDGSTDRTRDIIAEHEGTDSRFKFTYLDHSTNLGITKNYQRGFAACTGQYVAVLEGDDYWISPEKLLRQSAFLDAHWECDLCAVNYFTFEEERALFTARTGVGAGHRLLGARDQIANNLASNFSTCMYRKTALDDLPESLFEMTSYDWIVNICVASRSLIGFLEEPMSVYRLHAGGVWTQTKYTDQLRAQLTLIPAYDALTDHVFTKEFTALSKRLREDIRTGRGAPGGASRPRGSAAGVLIRNTPAEVVQVARMCVPSAIRRFLVRALYADSGP